MPITYLATYLSSIYCLSMYYLTHLYSLSTPKVKVSEREERVRDPLSVSINVHTQPVSEPFSTQSIHSSLFIQQKQGKLEVWMARKERKKSWVAEEIRNCWSVSKHGLQEW